MSDTYTPNYNLTLPAIGGDPNTWGQLLNDNFTTIDTAMEANKTSAAAAMTAATAASAKVDTVVPIGAMIFWDLNKGPVPSGWQLCDGTGTTPPAAGRFPVASTGSTGAYPAGATGGGASVMLDVSHMPAHAHTYTDNGHGHAISDNGHAHPVNDPTHAHTYPNGGSGQAGTDNGGGTFASGPNVYGSRSAQNTNASGTGVTIGSAASNVSVQPNGVGIQIQPIGGGQAFDNRPQYIALVLIQRIS